MRIRVHRNFLERAKGGRVHPGLRAGEEYYVLEVSRDSYRIVDHGGEPILYQKELFEVTDTGLPSGWHFREYEDGEYFVDPASVGGPGFYEDWFGSDGDVRAQQHARRAVRDELVRLAKESSAEDRRLIEEALDRLPASLAAK
jgi:hypothetical protein